MFGANVLERAKYLFFNLFFFFSLFEDLVSYIWNVVYRPEIGPELYNADVFHRGGPARQRKFLNNGFIQSVNVNNFFNDISTWRWNLVSQKFIMEVFYFYCLSRNLPLFHSTVGGGKSVK